MKISCMCTFKEASIKVVTRHLMTVAANLDKLISCPPSSKNITFRISAGINVSETPDEKALLGEISMIVVLNPLHLSTLCNSISGEICYSVEPSKTLHLSNPLKL